MASVNKVILIGNLGADPETKFTTVGKQVTEFRIATTFKWGDNEETEWHRIVTWDKTAEVAAKYLSKGNPVYVEGRIKTRSYDDKDGVKKYVTEVVADRLQLLGGKPADKAEETEAPKKAWGRKSVKPTTTDDFEEADAFGES